MSRGSDTPSTPVKFDLDENEEDPADQVKPLNGKNLEKFQLELEENSKPKSAGSNRNDLLYGLEDKPPIHTTIFLSLQHTLLVASSAVSYPYMLAPAICMRDKDPARGYLISTTFFISGIASFIQTVFGIRLPIVQGASVTFLVPILAIMSLPQWQCPTEADIINSRLSNDTSNVTDAEWTQVWQIRMAEVSGAIIVASMFEVLLGFAGIMGLLLKYITPLGITPCIALIGLTLYNEAAFLCAKNWPIAIATVVIMTLFSQYMTNIELPVPAWNKSKAFYWAKFPIFKLFPILLAIVISWGLCAVLTSADQLPPMDEARTDLRLEIIRDIPWFRIPYPGQFGMPSVAFSGVVGMLSAILASIVESVGDYYACARLSKAKKPPRHAINRGIMMEGIGCIFAGFFGAGAGLTSYSTNISIIAITKVACRSVVQWASVLMIIFGLISKLGGIFATIPDPVIGGTFIVTFAMVAAVGLSSVQGVDMNSTRNLFILGMSMFLGFMVPNYIKENSHIIKTGNDLVDSTIVILLSTSVFVGGFTGVFLDNTIPGSLDERGMGSGHGAGGLGAKGEDCYDVPFLNFQATAYTYLPFSPTYQKMPIRRFVRSFSRKSTRSNDV